MHEKHFCEYSKFTQSRTWPKSNDRTRILEVQGQQIRLVEILSGHTN